MAVGWRSLGRGPTCDCGTPLWGWWPPGHAVRPILQGLLRQLVLLPGADATPHICTAMNYKATALSIPAVLQDVPVKAVSNEVLKYPHGQ